MNKIIELREQIARTEKQLKPWPHLSRLNTDPLKKRLDRLEKENDMTQPLICCNITDGVACQTLATFHVHDRLNDPYSAIQTCTAHLPAMVALDGTLVYPVES